MTASASVFSKKQGNRNSTREGREFWDFYAPDERQNQTEGLVRATSTSLARMGEEPKREGAATALLKGADVWRWELGVGRPALQGG